MGRDLQKKKRRSSRQPIRQSNKPKKALNPRGNSIIAKNWNKNETMVQNYRRLGLVARLKAPTGGTEKKLQAAGATTARISADDPFAITTIEKAVVSEARVERDADGNIVRIIRSGRDNPLNDPLNELDSDEEDDEMEHDVGAGNNTAGHEWGGIADADEDDTAVIKSLVEQSKNPAEKTPRHQSGGEKEWLESLIAKHGDDTAAMARDRKLNPMQQTAADLGRRIRKMKNKNKNKA